MHASEPHFSYVNDRPWTSLPGNNFKLEVGRPGDLDELAACGGFGANAAAQQALLARYEGNFIPLKAAATKMGDKWPWLIAPNTKDRDLGDEALGLGGGEGLHFAALSDACVREVFEVAKEKNGRKARGFLFQFVWFDLSTVAMTSEDPRVNEFAGPNPWHRTRIWLAPIVSGLALGQTK
jgi:hypothetical protein